VNGDWSFSIHLSPPIHLQNAATIDAMLDDLAAYESHAAHFGAPSPS
jgi:hypothetical protein